MVSNEFSLNFTYLMLINIVIYRLYPVDKSRPDTDDIGEESISHSNKKAN